MATSNQTAKIINREGQASLLGVDMFSTIDHGENPLVASDLQAIVQNFERFCKSTTDQIHFNAPAYRLQNLPADAGIGHDEDQAFLKSLLGRTDLPAAGWVDRVWIENVDGVDHLKGDVVGIPATVADMIEAKELRHCSVEIDPNFAEGNQSYGPALKRISFLGASLPRIKNLAELPQPTWEFSEGGVNSILFFSEMNVMNRADMIAKLQGMGCNVSMITDATPDELIAEWLRMCSAAPTPAPVPMSDPPEPTPNSKPAFAEGDEEKMVKCSEQVFKRLLAPMAAQLSTLAATVKPLNEKIVFAERQNKMERLTGFVSKQVEAGRVMPYEADGVKSADGKSFTLPPLIDRLMAIDDSVKVHRFSDGSQLTALDAELKAIESRPSMLKFTEKIKDGRSGPAGETDRKMTPERRQQLLSSHPTGRAILAREKAAKASA